MISTKNIDPLKFKFGVCRKIRVFRLLNPTSPYHFHLTSGATINGGKVKYHETYWANDGIDPGLDFQFYNRNSMWREFEESITGKWPQQKAYEKARNQRKSNEEG